MSDSRASLFCLLAAAALVAAIQPDSAAQAHRNRGKAYYERGEYALAVSELLKVVEKSPAEPRDYFNAAMALLQNGEDDRALGAFTTAKQMDPKMIDVDFGLGVLLKRQQRFPQALAAFERVAAADASDPATWFNIGAVQFSMGNAAEAQKALDRLLAMGFEKASNFYVSALYRQATLLSRQGRNDEAQKLFANFQEKRPLVPGVSLTPQALENGRHARIDIPVPAGPASPAAQPVASLPRFSLLAEVRFAERPCEDQASIALGDYDADGRVDLFVSNPCGKNRLFQNRGAGRLVDVTAGVALGEGGHGALFIDYDNSGYPSLLVLGRIGSRFYGNRKGVPSDSTSKSGLGNVTSGVNVSAVTFDFDSDGQLDIFLTKSTDSAKLYRNNGDGSFRDVTAEMDVEKSALSAVRGAAFADFDNDGSADLLLVRQAEAVLLWNQGSGRFRSSPVSVGGRLRGAGPARVEVLDFNSDGWFDAFVTAEGGSVLLKNKGGQFELASNLREGFVLAPSGEFLIQDELGRMRWLHYAGRSGLAESAVAWPRVAAGEAYAADLEGRGNTDVVVAGADGVLRLVRRHGEKSASIFLTGEKSNRAAVGAVVELKAGEFYRKLLYRGLPLAVATGSRSRLDVVRVTWTNGVIQNEIDVAAGHFKMVESDRQTSSCPFLYAWGDGRFRFVTDIVGRAPLGEPLPDGGAVEPHPEDYVRIPPGALTIREGRYSFKITEELREIAYLDSVELLAIDHPEGGEIYADEKFSAPPFAPFRLYRVSQKKWPVKATTHGGQDVTELLARADGRYVGSLERERVPGVAKEHAIVLAPPDLPDGEPVRLFLKGWVYWVSSSGMRALSGNRKLTLHPPSLQVRDARGLWVTVIEDVGLPSGIDRTVVVDLTGKFLSSNHAVRITTNLRVYWDEAFFSVGEDRATLAVRALKPVFADLHYRGFSVPVLDSNGSKPDFYDYARLLEDAPWNAVSGRYAAFGDALPLLHASDNRLAVMAPGDELSLAFDEAALPQLEPGLRRDFVLHVTGWAKDNEPTTAASGSVEPLPFRGMGRYPYPPEEAIVVADERRTRDVPLQIPALAPPAGSGPGGSTKGRK